MVEQQQLIHPLILSGGSGTRLWPLSSRDRPKQFLPLLSNRSMLEETVLRFSDSPAYAAPTIVCGADQEAIVRDHLIRADCVPSRIVLEPMARGTAPAAAVAAMLLSESDREGLLLVLPADHAVRDLQALHEAIGRGAEAARAGYLVALGIGPDRAETGYGYIRPGQVLEACPGCHAIDGFVEKPDLETARTLVSEGRHLWNGGMFLFRVDRLLEELEAYEPEVLTACREAIAGSGGEAGSITLDPTGLEACPTISLDHAVMERTTKGAVVAVDMGWSDIGSWEALWQLRDHDGEGNAVSGPAVSIDTVDSYLVSAGPMVATIGLEGYVVVATKEAVLVCPMDRVQEVNTLVARLREKS